jgi:predicted metal-binding membrane protein
MFVMEHWTGEDHAWQALRLGLRHGTFCVGCCWTLMLLMFPFGAGSLAWMLVLGAMMAAEKNLPWGRRLGRPLGVVLLALGVVVAARLDARLW